MSDLGERESEHTLYQALPLHRGLWGNSDFGRGTSRALSGPSRNSFDRLQYGRRRMILPEIVGRSIFAVLRALPFPGYGRG